MSIKGSAESNILRGRIANPDVIHGKSAYEIDVMHGYDGTEEEWLKEVRGDFDDRVAEAKEEFSAEVDNVIVPNAKAELERTVSSATESIERHTASSQKSIDQVTEDSKDLIEAAATSLDNRDVLLWENEEINTDFTSGTISLNVGDEIERLRVVFVTRGIQQMILPSVEVERGKSGRIHFDEGFTGDDGKTHSRSHLRDFTVLANGNIQFEGAEPNNGVCIPYKVYGIKNKEINLTETVERLVVQTPGDSEVKVMSQKAVVNELNKLRETVGVTLEKSIYYPVFVSGKYIDSTGEIISAGSFWVSEYIDVSGYENITLTTRMGWGYLYYAFYDTNKSFISGLASPSGGYETIENREITIPPNAKYIVVSKTNDIEFTMYVGELKTDDELTKEVNEIKEEIDEIKDNVTASCVAYVSSGSFIAKSNGNIYSGASYGSTDFIPVNGGESIKIKGFHCPNGTNASVCAYDSNFTFIGAIITDNIDSGDGKVISLDNTAAYIRATSSNNGNIIVEYIDRPIAPKTTENAPYSLGTLTANGFVSKANGEVLTHTQYYGVTDFIEVTSRYLKIENPNLSGNCGICEYDENYNFISCVLSDVTGGQYVVRLNSNAKYIRATVVNNNAGWLRLYPVSSTNSNSETNDVVDSWSVATGNQIKTPFKKINALAPTVTFIDDDTVTFDAVKRYHDIFAAKGVKGCYAVVTDYLGESRDPNGELKNLLLGYEEEGFGMLFHAKWQDTFYMEGANRNIALAEADYCKGMRKMREIGFVDYNYWVSPYGVMDEEIASMCKRHGANCLMSTYNNTFIQSNGMNGNGESVERYAIPRCSLGYGDAEYPNFTLADLKAQIDRCVQANGWLIVTTHVAQWNDSYGTAPDERLGELIDYIKNKGCAIKTFAEAYAERNAILQVNDIC